MTPPTEEDTVSIAPPPAGTQPVTPALVVLLLIAVLVGAFWLADPSPAAPAPVITVSTTG